MSRVALHHLVSGLEARVGDVSHGELFVVGFLGGNDRRIGHQGEVDARVRHQVGLEFGEVDVQGSVEPEGCRDGGHDLTDQAVQVGVRGSLDVQVSAAYVVDGLVVDHEGAVGVLQRGVSGEDGVVRFDHCCCNLGSGVDGKLQLRLLTVVDRKAFHQ